MPKLKFVDGQGARVRTVSAAEEEEAEDETSAQGLASPASQASPSDCTGGGLEVGQKASKTS